MELETLTCSRKEALNKWREYNSAFKANKSPENKELKEVYNQIKLGRKLIQIDRIVKAGGVKRTSAPSIRPVIAIGKALYKKVFCNYYTNGAVEYKLYSSWSNSKLDIKLKAGTLDTFSFSNNTFQDHIKLSTAVPRVPQKVWNKKLTDAHYVLWEVDEWEMIPPEDPYLLQRITKTIFAVLAQWDLTAIEKAVMAERM